MTTFTFRPADDEGEHNMSEAPPAPLLQWACPDCGDAATTADLSVFVDPLCKQCGTIMTRVVPPPDAALTEARRWDAARQALGEWLLRDADVRRCQECLDVATGLHKRATGDVHATTRDCAGWEWPVLIGDVLIDCDPEEGTLTVRIVRRLS